MKIDFPMAQKQHAMPMQHAMLIRIPKVWEELTTDIIEECLRECGLELHDTSVVYLVQTPEPWTKEELDYLRKVAVQKLMKI